MLLAQDLLGLNRLPNVTTAQYGEPSYASSSPVHAHYPAPTSPYDNLAYTQNPIRPPFTLPPAPDARRFSQPLVLPTTRDLASKPRGLTPLASALQHHDRRGYPDAMDASHGLLSMSQETPRNIYAPPRAQRGSADSYGFPPTTHSTNSSISSTSNFSTYRESSLSDYSAMGSDMDLSRTRTLPRPQNLMTSQVPPAPQSLMSQFSSKVSSSTQKKHKCKVCDKRFTRPSSLQTHMYSHTGEKRKLLLYLLRLMFDGIRLANIGFHQQQRTRAKLKVAESTSRLSRIFADIKKYTKARLARKLGPKNTSLSEDSIPSWCGCLSKMP